MYNLNIQLPARLAFYVAIRIYGLFVMYPIFLGLRLAPLFLPPAYSRVLLYPLTHIANFSGCLPLKSAKYCFISAMSCSRLPVGVKLFVHFMSFLS